MPLVVTKSVLTQVYVNHPRTRFTETTNTVQLSSRVLFYKNYYQIFKKRILFFSLSQEVIMI